MSAVHRSAGYVYADTAVVSDGDFATATSDDLGEFFPGSLSVDRSEDTASGLGSAVGTGASRTISFRAYGAPVAAIVTAKDANPPTGYYLYFPNLSGTAYTRYGGSGKAGNFAQAYQVGIDEESGRVVTQYVFFCEGDTPEDIEVTVTASVTAP